ncbi:MAG: nicotinate (nicotinamide) nucleotide adenylyltransferase [Bacteroidales bacterium]
MKTGLFFGSFNPIHVGHLIIANYVCEFTDIEEVWLVISPQNPLKDRDQLLPADIRYSLARKAIGNYARLHVSDIELHLPLPSYTVNTLRTIKNTYKNREFALILGADSLVQFHEWKEWQEIERNYSRYVYPRRGIDVSGADLSNCRIMDAPLVDISSTMIRNAISAGKDVRFFLPSEIREEVILYYASGSSRTT